MSRLIKIRDLVRSGNFEAAKEELLNESAQGFVLPVEQSQSVYLRSSETNIDPFNNKNDRGNGRVSEGLKFLEIVSLVFKGKSVSSMLRFDKVPQYVRPEEFLQNNNTERKIELMSKSLGIEEILDEFRVTDKDYYNSFTEILLSSYDDVSSGNFREADNKTLLALCRGLYRRVNQ